MKKSLERSFIKSASTFGKIPVTSIEAPDNLTLVISLNSTFPALPAYLSKGESAALAPGSYDASGNVTKPIGTGPFIFESYKPEEEIVVVKNPDYWGHESQAPELDRHNGVGLVHLQAENLCNSNSYLVLQEVRGSNGCRRELASD